ncbi:LAETG motif-containing sortase-dependent surface protein, partial [Streptomyces sp. NPDC093260]|uniref:LAETG motif-containing sortase-dependent surface protein n=1 Tax=Streptomyces sp. NPDC093260 TaxID=3155073 RepID=UPI00342B91E2
NTLPPPDALPIAAATAGAAAATATAGSGRAGAAAPARDTSLAETGGDGGTPYLAVGGAAVLAAGSAVLFLSVRRRAATGGRHGR